MLVQTRKTIFGIEQIAQFWRRRKTSYQFRRNLLQGFVASILLAHAPAYASPGGPEPASLEQRTTATYRRGEVYHQGPSSRRASRARKLVRSTPRPYDKYAESESVPLADENPQPNAVIATGLASWYSADRYNKRTFSGVPFDETAMTAAHPWLPMGTRLRVTLLGTDTSVVVTINDRQGSKTRVIDLSKQAARELGILERGIARVVLSRL